LAVLVNSQGFYISWQLMMSAKKKKDFLGGLSSPPSKLSTFLAVLLGSQGNVAFSWRQTAKEMLVKGMLCFFSFKYIYSTYDNQNIQGMKNIVMTYQKGFNMKIN